MPQEITLDEGQTVARLLEAAIQAHAERPAATCLSETLLFRDIDRLSQAFANHLQTFLAKGDRVAVMLPTSLPFVVAMAGALRAGMTVVPVNPLYTPREVEHQLNDAGAAAIVAADAMLPTLDPVLARTSVLQVLTTPIAGLGAIAEELSRQAAAVHKHIDPSAAVLPLAAALRYGHSAEKKTAAIVPSDVAFLQYTGGTTGVSKGARLTHRNLCASTAQILSWLQLSLRPVGAEVITPLPLYHIYPLAIVLLCLTMGAHARLVPNPRDVGNVIAEMKRSPFDMLIGVNTLFNALVGAPELRSVDFSRTRVVVGAGASVQEAVAKRWADAGAPPITEAYGLTETSPSATFNPLGRNGCIGMPVPSTDARVVDDQGKDVAIGAPGELLLRGPQVFDGYWQRPEETSKAFTEDGWFKTGDVVTMDAEGALYLVDRKKDMILVSGFNVYPNEIEAVVAMMAEVLECACVGIPDERSGEAPHLFAVARAPELTAAKIEAHCRANLAGYKIPRRISLVDSLPKSTVGKILRRELRQQADQPSAE
jgi:long-chain acyl-CoA synthetase